MDSGETDNTEQYWTKAIAGFFKLGVRDATVPLSSFDYDMAQTIAFKLNGRVEVKGTDYVFRQTMVQKLMERED